MAIELIHNSTIAGTLTVSGNTTLSTIPSVGSDTDKFLMSNGGIVSFATGAEVLAYIGGGSIVGPWVPYVSGSDQIARTEGSATYNTSLGFQALEALAAGGNYNTALGGKAGTAITTGDYNVALGYNALITEDTGNKNVAIGADALKNLNYKLCWRWI